MSMTPKPNLFLVGAMKSGSSSLTKHLRAHPSIFMARKPKEPSYFVEREQLREVYPIVEKMGFWKSVDRYLELFAEAGEHPVIGEASQNYARRNRVTGVPERISSFNPDARILYIMRDPVERTISHYWYMVNLYGEGRSMMNAIREDADYVDTSYYAMQLEPYLHRFGRDRVRTLTLEELKREPVPTMQSLYEWLDVDADFVPPMAGKRANVTPASVSVPRGSGWLHRFRHSTLWERVGPYVPASVRRLGHNVSDKRVAREAISTDDVVDYLRPIQEAQTQELEDVLGQRFSAWRTLRPSGTTAS